MRNVHALLFVVILIVLSAGALWLLRGDSSSPTAAPAASTADFAAAPHADLEAGEQGDGPETPDDARVATTPTQAPEPVLDSAPSGPRLGGRVIDAMGNPVADARVLAASNAGMMRTPLDSAALARLSWVRLFETRTDEEGRYELVGPPPGGLRMAVRAEGFAPWDRDDLALPAGEGKRLDDVVLEPSVVLSGFVLDSAGKGVAGAEIFRLASLDAHASVHFSSGPSGALVATTDAQGSFRIDQLASGPWALQVEAEEHPSHVERGTVERAGAERHGLEIRLPDGYAVSGRVIGAPAELAGRLMVRARPSRGEGAAEEIEILDVDEMAQGLDTRAVDCAEDGSFSLGGLRIGQTYDLVAQQGGPTGMARTCSRAHVVTGGLSGVELAYQVESALLFQVVDARTRQPLTEFDVSSGMPWPLPLTDGEGRRLREHAEGRVRIGDLRPREESGEAKLQVSAVGYETYSQEDIRVPRGEELDLGVIALEPVPVVRVSVTDRATGEPVEGARVVLSSVQPPGMPEHGGGFQLELEAEAGEHYLDDGSGGSRRAKTDAEGVAVVSSIEGETCTVRVTHKEFASHTSEEFFTALGEQRELQLELGRGGSVEIQLVTEDGDPLAGARVEHQAPDVSPLISGMMLDLAGHGGKNPVTDAEGKVLFEHLTPGLHRFRPAEDASSGVFFSDDGGDGDAMVMISGRSFGQDEGPEPGWSEVEVAEGARHQLQVVAPRRVSLTGRVREGGKPLAGATVSLVEETEDEHLGMMAMFGAGGPRAKTNGQGAYELQGVKAGSYKLTVTHPSRRMPTEYPIEIADTDERFDVELAISVVEGRILDEAGEGVPGVRVWAERAVEEGGPRRVAVMRSVFVSADGEDTQTTTLGSGGSDDTRSDADGFYSLRGVLPDVDLVIKAEGRSLQPGQSEVFDVAPDQVRGGVDVRLGRAGEVEVTALRADGSPGENLLVTAVYEGEDAEGVDPQTEFVGGGGKATLRGLRPGTWRLSFRTLGFGGGGGEDQPEVPDQTVEIEFDRTAHTTVQLP